MADEDADGGFIVVHGDGYGNPSAGLGISIDIDDEFNSLLI